MPNGFMGSKEEWQRMEAPYGRIDPLLHAFAERHGLVARKNYHDADRSLLFNDSLNRAIWVGSTDRYGTSGTYMVSVLAYQDRPERFVKGAVVASDVPVRELDAALERAVEISSSWSASDLERDFPPEFRPVARGPRNTLQRVARLAIMLPVALAATIVGATVSGLMSIRELFRRDDDGRGTP